MEDFTMIVFLVSIGLFVVATVVRKNKIPLRTLTVVLSVGGLYLALGDATIIKDSGEYYISIIGLFAIFLFTMVALILDSTKPKEN